MTTLIAFGVLSYVWEGHFQEYTHDNMERTADSTAMAISEKYAETQRWSPSVLGPASSAADLNDNVGIQVVDAQGTVRYDNYPDRGNTSSLASTYKSHMVSAPIIVEGKTIGSVNVWVYGSDTMLTKADREYRDGSYRAMLVAAAIAILISIGLGFLFARGLVDPINRMTRTAKAIKEGDLTARTRLVGDDEVSHLGETFDACIAGTPIPSAGKYDLPAALAQNLSAISLQLQTPYLKYFIAMDARPLLGSITCPVMALNGTKDTQVDHESNLGALRNGLPVNAKNQVETIEGVNHLFQHCQTGAATEYRDIEETISPEVLEKMVQWLSEL
jgi:HAMP domain-containing protein